jgi:hypothetical protein
MSWVNGRRLSRDELESLLKTQKWTPYGSKVHGKPDPYVFLWRNDRTGLEAQHPTATCHPLRVEHFLVILDRQGLAVYQNRKDPSHLIVRYAPWRRKMLGKSNLEPMASPSTIVG